MSVLISTKSLPEEANGTRILLFIMDTIFDLLNNCNPNIALRSGGKSREELILYLKLLDSFEFQTSAKISCLNNLKISIRCFLSFQKFLEENYSIEYVLTRHYNQDCLENLFSIVRYEADENGNIRPEIFRKVFSSIIFSDYIKYKKIENKNCLDDSDIFLKIVKKKKLKIDDDKIDNNLPNIDLESFDYAIFDQENKIDPQYLTLNVSTYIAGFLLKKLENFICSKCFCLLISNDNSQPGLEFTNAKEWQGHSLKKPNFLFSNFVKIFNDFFNDKIEEMWYLENLRNIFCNQFLDGIGPMFNDLCCNLKMLKFCTHTLFRVLITHYLKKKNDKLLEKLLKTKKFLKSK